MILETVIAATLTIVVAFMAEKVAEKWKKPLWPLFAALVILGAVVQIYSRNAERKEADQREAKLNEKLDSVSGQLRTSLLAQGDMNGQLKSMQLIIGNLGKAGYPGMKEIAGALTILSHSNARRHEDIKSSNKQICDKALAFAGELIQSERRYSADLHALMSFSESYPDLTGKTPEQQRDIIQETTRQHVVIVSQFIEGHYSQLQSRFMGEAKYLRDLMLERLPIDDFEFLVSHNRMADDELNDTTRARPQDGEAIANYLEQIAKTLCKK